jgi:replicative DNA helicase
MSDERYHDDGYTPYAEPVSNLYGSAHRELALPFPATRLARFPKLTQMTGGLRPYEFTILCGATGSGKTTLCANISRDLIEQKIPHFVASVETGHTDFVKRVMSAMAEKDWNTGDPVPLERLKDFHSKHGHLFEADSAHLSLYDNRIPVETLMADIDWMVKNRGVRVAMIDNLNFFLEVTRAADMMVEMDRVIHELIIFCKRVDVHIIMVMHPKKNESGRVESEHDIKGSSTANQEAHNILLFNRPHPDLVTAGVAREGDREVLIAKMRRKGKFVRRRLVLRSIDGVAYFEGDIV